LALKDAQVRARPVNAGRGKPAKRRTPSIILGRGGSITLLVFEDLKAQGTDFGLALLQSRSFTRDGIKAGDQFPIGKGAGSVSGNGIHDYSGFRLVELFAKLVKKGIKGLGKAETCHTYNIGIVVKT
jgi:hypothetical protein